jgi:hypothetical protein
LGCEFAVQIQYSVALRTSSLCLTYLTANCLTVHYSGIVSSASGSGMEFYRIPDSTAFGALTTYKKEPSLLQVQSALALARSPPVLPSLFFLSTILASTHRCVYCCLPLLTAVLAIGSGQLRAGQRYTLGS